MLRLGVQRNEFRLRVLQWDALSCPERVLGFLLTNQVFYFKVTGYKNLSTLEQKSGSVQKVKQRWLANYCCGLSEEERGL